MKLAKQNTPDQITKEKDKRKREQKMWLGGRIIAILVVI